MADQDALEKRRIELEEQRDKNNVLLREKELEIEALKARIGHASQGAEQRGRSHVALISVLSAVIGAAASMGAAYLTGNLSVQERQLVNAAQASLEQQKFSYELITTALSEEDDQTRAQRLRFMVDIGLLGNLRADKLIEYADLEAERIEQGDERPSYLPYTQPQKQMSMDRAILPGYALRLVATGNSKINVIKAIREVTGMGLQDSKTLSETPGELIITGLAEATANDFASRLIEAGATVEVELIEITK
ncbi:MAG: ribosomal protein L7/L12 [Sedimentitalea sp.]|uniref:ribosomal protein L7/L12 n=1 Tax=Sedimentitalea sp. TaxID=2048915 RepID=UPI003264C8F0